MALDHNLRRCSIPVLSTQLALAGGSSAGGIMALFAPSRTLLNGLERPSRLGCEAARQNAGPNQVCGLPYPHGAQHSLTTSVFTAAVAVEPT